MSKRTRKNEDPAVTRRKRLVAVWEDLRGALGGDGWDDWSEDEIVAALDSWVDFDAPREGSVADELIDQSYDPRDIRDHYRRTNG